MYGRMLGLSSIWVKEKLMVSYASWHICTWVPFIHKKIEGNRPDRTAERGHTNFDFEYHFDSPPPTLDQLQIGLRRHEYICSLPLLLQHLSICTKLTGTENPKSVARGPFSNLGAWLVWDGGKHVYLRVLTIYNIIGWLNIGKVTHFYPELFYSMERDASILPCCTKRTYLQSPY